MQQIDTNRIVRGVLAVGCAVAASVCLVGGYLVPAVLMSGQNWSNPAEGWRVNAQLCRALFPAAAVLGLAAGAFAVWALLPTRRPAA